jgi:phosphohistidine phosphatase
MELILWRHADAEAGDPDLERELTEKGRKQAKRVAAWLRERLPRDARVLVSPARRAQQTAQALAVSFETEAALAPGAPAKRVLAAAGWPDASGTVVVVGHQPALGRSAALVLAGAPSEWSIKKGGAWWLERRDDGEVVLRAVVSPDLA